MQCPELRNKSLAFIDQSLPLEEMRTAQSHLEHCEECRQLIAVLRLTWGGPPPQIEVPPDFALKVRRKVREQGQPGMKPARPVDRWLPILKPVGVALLLALSTYAGRWLSNAEGQMAESGIHDVAGANTILAAFNDEIESPLLGAYLSLMEQ